MLDVVEVDLEININAPRKLNRSHDRCDRCGSEAFIIAFKNDMELLFCGHHGKENIIALKNNGWNIQDYTDMINKKPSISANAE